MKLEHIRDFFVDELIALINGERNIYLWCVFSIVILATLFFFFTNAMIVYSFFKR